MAISVKQSIKVLAAVIILAIIAFLVVAPGILDKSRNSIQAHEPYSISQKAQDLHETLIIGDWHADSLLWQRNLLNKSDRGQVDIPRLQEGNFALQVFAAVTKSPKGQNYQSNSANSGDNITLLAMGQLWPTRTWGSIFERAVYQADKLHRFEKSAPNDLMIVKSIADLDTLFQKRENGEKIVGGLLGIEGAHPLEGDISNLPKLVDAGYRVIALQHFFDNLLGGSLHGENNLGLTEFGKEVVRYVEQNNLILDLAHSSTQVAYDAVAMTNMPIVVSHTGIYSHCNTPRNIPDKLMKEIAATGGVIAIGFWKDVTCDASPKGVALAIQAAIKLLGEDAVSLGSDFDGTVQTGMDASELPALTQAMMEIGLSETQIRKVMGENMLRVIRARLK